MKKIEYRNYKNTDSRELCRLMGEIYGLWQFFQKREDIYHFSKIILEDSLAKSDFARVVVADGELAGMIAGYTGKERSPALFCRISNKIRWLRLKLHKRNKGGIKSLYEIHQMDEKLWKNEEESTVVLSVIRKDLNSEEKESFWKEWEKHITSEKRKHTRIILGNFYDISFYEKMGYKKILEEERVMPSGSLRFRRFRSLYVK